MLSERSHASMQALCGQPLLKENTGRQTVTPDRHQRRPVTLTLPERETCSWSLQTCRVAFKVGLVLCLLSKCALTLSSNAARPQPVNPDPWTQTRGPWAAERQTRASMDVTPLRRCLRNSASSQSHHGYLLASAEANPLAHTGTHMALARLTCDESSCPACPLALAQARCPGSRSICGAP